MTVVLAGLAGLGVGLLDQITGLGGELALDGLEGGFQAADDLLDGGVDNLPKVRGICDVCGGEVVQREDDTEEAISRRLEIYEEQTAPLIDWYRERGQLAQVAGTGTPETVTKRIVRAIEDRRNRKGGRFT